MLIMQPADLFFNLIDRERNIYEPATLYDQARKPVQEYIKHLSLYGTDEELEFRENELVCKSTGHKFPVVNNVIDFTQTGCGKEDPGEWERLNARFLNYHKSLTVYTMMNSLPGINYLSFRSGLGNVKNARVVDIGGGTGHTLCSFFQYPETIDYFLVDPNLRLLHDQFIRLYPKLTHLKMAHILAYAEKLPFKSGFADLVLSLSSIDHFKDYHQFFRESFRILKPGGKLFVSSHLDIEAAVEDSTMAKDKIFSHSFWEKVSRYLYYRKYKVGSDDHTFHFKSIDPIEDAMQGAGFKTIQKEQFKRHFYIIGNKC